jgi:hypothetical protein
MPTSWLTALALSVQIIAPALPSAMPVQPAESPQLYVAEASAPPAGRRLLLADPALIRTLAPVRDAAPIQQAGPQGSKRGRIITGAIIGFVIGSVVGATVGQNADVCGGKPKWVCVALGGGLGALTGAMAARGK